MPKVGFVVNPRGGRGGALKAWKSFSEGSPGHPVYFTESDGDGTNQASKAVADGCTRVAAVGGDGTVNEVANALVGSEVELAVVPVGTGNDYVRTLGVPYDASSAFQLALEGSARPVDVGIAEGHRHFVNIAGIGFDAEVMTAFNNPGPVARVMPVKVRYYLSILKTFASFKGVEATLTIDGVETHVDNLLLLAVGCAQFYGAGMHILPGADLNDGLFDLAWGHDVRMAELNKLMSLIYKGAHLGHPNVQTRRCQELVFESKKPARFHLDGDVTGETPVTFRCLPAALQVVRPQSEKAM